MPKTRPFRDLLLDSLSNPEVAAAYLTEAYAESPAMFCKALRNVAQSRQMASVARQAGVTRESLYRATSDIGNPTLDTLASVLDVLGLGVEVYSRQAKAAHASPPIAISRVVGGTHRIAAKRANLSQLAKKMADELERFVDHPDVGYETDTDEAKKLVEEFREWGKNSKS